MGNVAAWVSLGLLGFLMGCQPAAPNQEARSTFRSPVSPAVVDTAAKPRIAAELGAAQLYEPLRYSADTLLRIEGRQLKLRMQARLDTTQHLKREFTKSDAGYQGYFTFELRDSLARLVGRRVLKKQAFYKAVGTDLAVLSRVELPMLLGYSAPLQALVFTVNFNASDIEWACEAVLLLDLQGRVQRLVTGDMLGGADLYVALAADGRTLLTSSGIIRAGQSTLPLSRPRAELRGAFLMNDSLAITIYEFGQSELTHSADGGTDVSFNATTLQKRQPNAFVLNTRTGKTVGRFHYAGFYEELGYVVPYAYLPATGTVYLLDEKKGLYALAAARPAQVKYWPFKSLQAIKSPRRAAEAEVRLTGMEHEFRFLIDTLAPTRIRYQRQHF